jgi:hypothetical protein
LLVRRWAVGRFAPVAEPVKQIFGTFAGLAALKMCLENIVDVK